MSEFYAFVTEFIRSKRRKQIGLHLALGCWFMMLWLRMVYVTQPRNRISEVLTGICAILQTFEACRLMLRKESQENTPVDEDSPS